MEPNEKIPGVTFHVVSSSLKNKTGKVVLDAVVNDLDLWPEVMTRLDELRIYTVSDLTTAMIEILQEENRELKESADKEVTRLREELERASQRLSFYEEKERKEQELVRALTQLQLPVTPMATVDYPHGLQRDREAYSGDVRPPDEGGGVDP